jgi:ABC-type nitrate/sulfonate/bicarbonate transport system substrate-binding protein
MTFRTLAILLALAGFSSAHAASATLRFGQIPSTARAVSSLYLYVAEKQGFFARENVAVEVVQIPGGTGNMVAALDRGEVDVTQTATPYLIRAALAGSPAVAIAGTTANPIYSLIAKPEIKDFTDLKGKLIGLSLPVDTISISMRKLFALKGLDQADYRVKELVGSPLRAACLKSGECDAVPLGQPDDLIAIKDGYRRLGLSTEAVASFQFEAIAARRDFAETHVPALIGFVSALADAFHFTSIPIVACCHNTPKSMSAASPKSSPSWARAAPSSRRFRRRSNSSIGNTFARPAHSSSPLPACGERSSERSERR